MRRLWHRVRQFFGALRPRVTQAERADAYRWLSPHEQELFESMMLRDQQHGIIVYRRVRKQCSSDDPELFAAALLHDCGKGIVALWQRVAYVVLRAAWPSQLTRLGPAQSTGWRGAFWRLRYHPGIGAELAASAGSATDTVRLIREQEHESGDVRLKALQAADEA
jgi:hypothetical protein